MSLLLISLLFTVLKLNYPDPLPQILNDTDTSLVSRAREVVTNAIMAEIAKEDQQGHTEYRDAIRHQIVASFHRLRLSLLVLDTLIEAYNASK